MVLINQSDFNVETLGIPKLLFIKINSIFNMQRQPENSKLSLSFVLTTFEYYLNIILSI
jgi:hypothetical protein